MSIEKLDLSKSFDKFKTLTMQTLTINAKISKSIDETIELPIPFYSRSKDEKDWLTVLDENTVVKFTVIQEYAALSRGSMHTFKDDVIKAWQTYHACTEAEFLSMYDEVMDSMHPTLKP